jgi:hypothetical protein
MSMAYAASQALRLAFSNKETEILQGGSVMAGLAHSFVNSESS